MAALPRQNRQSLAQHRSKLDVNSALDTLCAMFENIDREVVTAVLIEGCNGNMETAVEALLSMCSVQEYVEPQSRRQQQQSANDFTVSNISFTTTQPSSTPATNSNSNANVQPTSTHPFYAQQQQWLTQQQQHMLDVSDDFLRPPSYYLAQYSNHNTSQSQIPIKQPKPKTKSKIEPNNNTLTPLPKNKTFRITKLFRKTTTADNNYHHIPSTAANDSEDNDNVSTTASTSANVNANANANSRADNNQSQVSLKGRFSTLSSNAKERFANFTDKLKKAKAKTTMHDKQKYTSALTSLDDESGNEEEEESENGQATIKTNAGTYVPPKPSQEL